MDKGSLESALMQFEATEANLRKLDSLWAQIRALIGNDVAFGSPPGYDDACRAFRHILRYMPSIDGTRIDASLLTFDEVGDLRYDARDLGNVDMQVSVERQIEHQGEVLNGYRFLLVVKRRELVRFRITKLIEDSDKHIRLMIAAVENDPPDESTAIEHLSELDSAVTEIDTLIGISCKPPRWSELLRHIRFRTAGDMHDIARMDWPMVKRAIIADQYGENDPLPVAVSDLASLVAGQPKGPVSTKLNWAAVDEVDFERLMFVLISTTTGYENPAWLQHTNAADRGRDLSVDKVADDLLDGVRRQRVIIQCKHWQTKSVSVGDVSSLRSQMELWQPPRVDILVIAATGRFTVDAVDLIEKHNQSNKALTISMWPVRGPTAIWSDF